MKRRDARRVGAGQSLTEFALLLPILLVIFVAVVDLARVWTTMLSVEAAAREAADWGAFQSSNWIGSASDPTSNRAKTIEGMIQRACTASSTTPDYVGGDSDCTNPTLSWTLVDETGADVTNDPTCTDETRNPPCRVKVSLVHTFHLIVPVNISIRDIQIGFPTELTIHRESIFAISDLKLPQPTSAP